MTASDWEAYFYVLGSIVDKFERWKEHMKPMLNEEQWASQLNDQHRLIAELTAQPKHKTDEILAIMRANREKREAYDGKAEN